jgi:hypothetical protein
MTKNIKKRLCHSLEFWIVFKTVSLLSKYCSKYYTEVVGKLSH